MVLRGFSGLLGKGALPKAYSFRVGEGWIPKGTEGAVTKRRQKRYWAVPWPRFIRLQLAENWLK